MTDRRIVARIEAYNAGRIPSRLEQKYHAMRSDPFVFFRATAHLFWEDWARDAGALNEVPLTWSCGDLHLENFGCYRGDNDLVYFDLNDFDEAALGPATADVVRLLTSTYLAAQSLGLSSDDAKHLGQRYLDAYTTALLDGKARWVERATSRGMVRELLRSVQLRRQKDLLNPRTKVAQGHRRLRLSPGRVEALAPNERARVTKSIDDFAKQQDARTHTRGSFRVIDAAARIAGTGSLGVHRYIVLAEGDGGPNGQWLLDVKQVGESVMATHLAVPQPEWNSQAGRVVQIQRRMQAVSAALLAPVGIAGDAYVLRELQPTEDRIGLSQWNGKLSRLGNVLTTMGHITAWSQLRSASRQDSSGIDELMGFGKAGVMRGRLLEYARRYAAVVRRDWKEFANAEGKPA